MTYPGALFTDLYELTMAAGYYEQGLFDQAVFSLYTRSHPDRGFFVAAGLEQVIDALTSFEFSSRDLQFLKDTSLFSPGFLNYLSQLRFTGDVHAMAEGTLFFAEEPVLEIRAPIIEAQLIETRLINTIGLASMIATKAARCVHAAQGRNLIDFSLRRTQGADAGMTAARSSYLAGFISTSNVLAGQRYGIPIAGTMAHSFVMAFNNELDAFLAYARLFPERTVLLIDTYDTLSGAQNAVQVAKQMRSAGQALKGVRLDSGDMVQLSRDVRRILDEAGFDNVKIFASGAFDEYSIIEALNRGAAIDAFGVGTKMGVSADAPFMDMVYKLARIKGRNVRKYSSGKRTLGGEKQVFRLKNAQGAYARDIIGHRGETFAQAKPLLLPVIKSGRRTGDYPALETLRNEFRKNFQLLPEDFRRINSPAIYPVSVSERLQRIQGC
ncbi:MAG: nicotinate phosphoribosyltransferase [Desulfobacteraceae bacterium]|nr:nicotinate phosphoribosyltransferase [Desulfobacteraceae bacterium]